MTATALALVERILETRARLRGDARESEALTRLQRWQVERLARTYADCYATERYREALDFFMQDLYGPHDVSARDRDLKRVLETWQRVLPPRALDALTAALELEALSQELDSALLAQLDARELNESSYADAYRRADRRKDRERQIWLIVYAGRALDALIDMRWVKTALRAARLPARVAGLTVLHEFLERGYGAFAKMGGAEELLRTIEQRERAIMKRLFAGAPQPFELATQATSKVS